MKYRSLIVMAALVLLASCQKAEWIVVSPGDGAISISMPAAPKASTQKVATPAGDIEVSSFVFEQEDIAYSITYSDFPEALIQASNAEKLLIGARDGAVNSTKGTLVSDAPITLENFPGREMKIDTPDAKHVVVSRIYLVNNRLYQAAVAMPKSAALASEATKFFDSFKLLRK